MKGLPEVVARVYTKMSPRAYEVMSVLLMSTGVNVLTLRVEPPVFDELTLSGGLVTTAGVLLFLAAARLDALYEIARRRAQEPQYQGLDLSELAFLAIRSRSRSVESQWRDVVLWLCIMVSLLLGGGLLLLRMVTSPMQERAAIPAWTPSSRDVERAHQNDSWGQDAEDPVRGEVAFPRWYRQTGPGMECVTGAWLWRWGRAVQT